MPEHPIELGLCVSGLRKDLGIFQLKADFEVRSGERAALIGRSGSGKTTLLRILAGLEFFNPPKDEGEITLGGVKITRLPAREREVGLVFQDQALFPSLTVLENAAFGLRMRGVSRLEREAQALPWLEKVGLAGICHQSITRLSGGEGQRVAFIRALLWKPRLLLLDEPFSSLDGPMRAVMRRELTDFLKLWPVPLILVSHDEADLEAVVTCRLGFHEEGNSRIVRPL